MIDVEGFIKKQIIAFEANELLENREKRPGRGREGSLLYGPYLLVSREKGAGGDAVARVVGKRLGWQVFDNEIVDEIAKQAHVRRQLIESLDERDRIMIDDVIRQVLDPGDIGKSGYMGLLRQIVLTLGHQGDVIIVGRAGRFILPNQFGVSVRMVAPIDVRARRIAEEAGMSLKAARALVGKVDRERGKLVQRNFGHDVADPLSHDLVINTAELSVEAAGEVILTALQRKLGVQIKERAEKRR